MVTNINPGDSSSSSCSLSGERKDLTASVVITVDTPSKSCTIPADEADGVTSPTRSTAGDTTTVLSSTPIFAPNSESTPLTKRTNVHNLRNSQTMLKNSSPLPDEEQLIGQQQGQPPGETVRNVAGGSDADTTTGATGGAGLSPRYGVGSLSLPPVFAPGRSKLLTNIPSKEGGGDSTCSEYVRPGEDVACWWAHPKVRENWRVFVAAFGLLVLGTALIAMGIVVCVLPEIGFQSYVFFIAGFFCFIPGAYHVVYVYCAVKGRKGYDFYQLPLFN